jgi:hypothetical protein
MRRGILVLVVLVLLLGVVVVEEMIRFHWQQPIEFVIFQSDKQDNPVGQGMAWLGRRVLLNLRPSEQDIQQLNGDAGARLIAILRDQAFAKVFLERCIERGLKLESLDRTGQWTAVQAAAIEGNLAGVKLLLEKGAEPKQAGADGRSLIDLLNKAMQKLPDEDYHAIIQLFR